MADRFLIRIAGFTVALCCAVLIGLSLVVGVVLSLFNSTPTNGESVVVAQSQEWIIPDLAAIPETREGAQIRYGRELISHTAKYLGPRGTVASISNGMNCQNCHLRAGTKPYGNNYAMVASTYPRFRARSGTVESVEKRINDCIERSLNGKALASDSEELQAMKAYILWVGQGVAKNVKPSGAGLKDIPFLDRAADPLKGRVVYEAHCQRCHGANARGRRLDGMTEWVYPPLCGDSSYNTGAGLLRLSRFAAYVKSNMPDGTTHDTPVLSDEEAWDVAAFVNSLQRPAKDLSGDWPDVAAKPFDHPFGPYVDSFSESEHKYGPFIPITQRIAEVRKK
jgi:thiosulfate dehydrogenase